MDNHLPLLRFRRAPLVLSPALLTTGVWVSVGALYSFHLSDLLLYSTGEVVRVIALIVGPALFVSFVFGTAYTSQKPLNFAQTVVLEQPPVPAIEHRVRIATRMWIFCAVVETIVSGGVPLAWLLTGSSKNYFDYGIPSVHGLVNSLLLALVTTSFALYLFTGRRRHLALPLFSVLWFSLLVTRGTIIFVITECLVIFLCFRRVKWSVVFQFGLLGSFLLLVFGYVGDFRTGAEVFKSLAQPTADFPDWAPSGLLWAYIYITTPLNNLLYSMHTLVPGYKVLLPNTVATLFPTVLRNIVYGSQEAQAASSGGLVTEAFNVSTAYVGPFQDMGRWGVAGFSAFSTVLCEIYWRRSGFRNILIFSVFMHTLILSLFYNLLLYLPILGQIVWFIYFTHQPRARAGLPELRPEKNYA